MTARYRAIAPADLPVLLADRIAARPGIVRVAIDGPPCAAPHQLGESLGEPLRARGRPVAVVRAETFWQDASLRLEYGREDVEAYLGWLDADALRREVLDPVVADATYLPSLRDPATNRATREPARRADPGTVLVITGPLLLGLGLPFEVAVHLAVSSPARRRRTDASWAWTLSAFDRYDAEVRPAELADVVIRLDDPRHPAVRIS